jgi:hypothetical protein
MARRDIYGLQYFSKVVNNIFKKYFQKIFDIESIVS